MKKTLLVIFAVSFFFSCSVEPMDQYLEEGLDQELKMTTDANDCIIVHSFGDAGTITVTNDGEHLLVTIAASGDFSLTRARLQVSNDYDDFPIVGRGNLPPGKMEVHKKFKDGVQEETWKFPLGTGSMVIASFSEFESAGGSFSAWAGDKEVKFGNWAYFDYEIVDCPSACEPPVLGENVILNYSYAESLNLGIDDLKDALGYNDEGFPTGGEFEPSLEVLLADIQDYSGEELQEYSTIYTVGEGDCTASIELNIGVAKCIDAGEDNSITVDYQDPLYADYEDVVKAFHELLEHYPSDGDDYNADDFPGDFEPSIEDIIEEYQEWKDDTDRCESIALTTTYTISNDTCEDSAELTIVVSSDPDSDCEPES